MQLYQCTVRLNGNLLSEVVKINVTVPEIIVLQHVHGLVGGSEGELTIDQGVVTKIEPNGVVERTDTEERNRLAAIYGPALSKIESVKNLNGLFGIAVPLPKSIEALGVGVVVPDEAPKRVGRPKKSARIERDMDAENRALAEASQPDELDELEAG